MAVEKKGQLEPISSLMTGGGMAAAMAPPKPYTVSAGPSTDQETNTIRARLKPVGCWRLEDVRFEFDSSFITPRAARDFRNLALLMEAHPGSPISLFGHADPVGSDDYNKKLSGRRVISVYGMLTRNTDMWEGLYSTPLGGDDWSKKVLFVMLMDLGYLSGPDVEPEPEEISTALKKFQKDSGLGETGENDSGTREKLFLTYMDKHCCDDQNEPFKLDQDNFLARGRDKDGKGDYQGCSEFNPVLMFSQEESREYEKSENKAERNAENATNRRVVAYLFGPGSEVVPDAWPCPRAKDGSLGCKKRFWSDGAKRRRFQDERRQYETTRDTFACRFYQHLVSDSPCESTVRYYNIRLFDPFLRPIAQAPYRLTAQGQTTEGVADADGWARGKYILTDTLKASPEKATIEWGYPPVTFEEEEDAQASTFEEEEDVQALRDLEEDESILLSGGDEEQEPVQMGVPEEEEPILLDEEEEEPVQMGVPEEEEEVQTFAPPPKLVYTSRVSLLIDDLDEETAARQRLDNLGFSGSPSLKHKIKTFQSLYSQDQTGELADINSDLQEYHDSAHPKPLVADDFQGSA